MDTKITILNSTLHNLFTLYTYDDIYSIENIYSYFFEEDLNHDLTSYSYDHKKYTKELANIITEFIEYEIINYSEIIQKYITDIDFNGNVKNPRFYNYSTDTFELELCINKKELKKRFNYLLKNEKSLLEDIKTILENDRLDMLDKLSFNDYKFYYNYTNYSAKNEIEAYLIWYYLKKEEDIYA